MRTTTYKGKCVEIALWNFRNWVLECIQKTGEEIATVFDFDSDTGKMIAYCSDGTTILQNVGNNAVTVKWGSGHTAMLKV